jgi:hypothetical protein
VGVVRAEEQPHPEAKKRHHRRDGVEQVHGEEVRPRKVVHVPFRVMLRGVDVEQRHIFPCKTPVVACFASSTVRRGVRHKQREEDDQKGRCGLTCKEGLGVEGLAPHGEVGRQLEDGGVAGGHCQVFVVWCCAFFEMMREHGSWSCKRGKGKGRLRLLVVVRYLSVVWGCLSEAT